IHRGRPAPTRSGRSAASSGRTSLRRTRSGSTHTKKNTRSGAWRDAHGRARQALVPTTHQQGDTTMDRKYLRPAVIAGVLIALAMLGLPQLLRANDGDRDHDDDRDDHGRPPQTLRQGFESTDRLLRDVDRAEQGPLHSAWLVESSRFVNVPHRSFQPDVGNPATVDLPVNVGIIKSPDGQITLYDTGWKQLAYIFDWNTSCCWKGLRDQMTAIGLNPHHVSSIVLGHGHWDHAGQLSEFPNAVMYIQKEELKQIDFFLDYPTEFNGGHIRAVNTV